MFQTSIVLLALSVFLNVEGAFALDIDDLPSGLQAIVRHHNKYIVPNAEQEEMKLTLTLGEFKGHPYGFSSYVITQLVPPHLESAGEIMTLEFVDVFSRWYDTTEHNKVTEFIFSGLTEAPFFCENLKSIAARGVNHNRDSRDMTECQEYVKGLVELGFKSKFSMYLTRIAGDYYGVNKAVLFVIFDYESNKVVQILFDLYHEI